MKTDVMQIRRLRKSTANVINYQNVSVCIFSALILTNRISDKLFRLSDKDYYFPKKNVSRRVVVTEKNLYIISA